MLGVNLTGLFLTHSICSLSALPPLQLYGVPQNLDNIELVTPDLTSEQFLWKECDICPEGQILPHQLECCQPSPDPPGGTYPHAPEFRLCSKTRMYMRGYAYVTSWNVADRDADFRRLLYTRMPSNVTPVGRDCRDLKIEPIPGMIRLVPGVPFVYHLDGDIRRPVTVACLQTPQSLAMYPKIANDIQTLTDQLLTLTFGDVQDGILVNKPIYQFPGLKRNQRSAKVSEGSCDGSFNLTATVGQGDGQGCYMPAAQLLDPSLQRVVAKVTSILHKFFRLIVPCCISKFEWDVTEFHSRVNNVFGFGGFEPNNTGLQMNVSSGFSSLAQLIGEHQGTFHTDQHDHPPRYTLLTLCFNLPEGMCSMLQLNS